MGGWSRELKPHRQRPGDVNYPGVQREPEVILYYRSKKCVWEGGQWVCRSLWGGVGRGQLGGPVCPSTESEPSLRGNGVLARGSICILDNSPWRL